MKTTHGMLFLKNVKLITINAQWDFRVKNLGHQPGKVKSDQNRSTLLIEIGGIVSNSSEHIGRVINKPFKHIEGVNNMLRIQVVIHFYGVSSLSASVHSSEGVTLVSQYFLHYQWASIASMETLACPMWSANPFPKTLPFIVFDSLLFRDTSGWGGSV
jgi:hypothetical protein